jgi:hypothetical protein
MDWELILEAERRGILPPDKAELLAEARKRGLVPGEAQAVEPTAQPIAEPAAEQAPQPEPMQPAAQAVSATPTAPTDMRAYGVNVPPPVQQQPDQAAPELTYRQTFNPPQTTAAGVLGAVTRGVAPVATGAALGGAVGGPPGAAIGAGTMAAAPVVLDPAVRAFNERFGTNYPTVSQAFQDLLTRVGVSVPATPTERAVETGARGVSAGIAAPAGVARAVQAVVPAGSVPARVAEAVRVGGMGPTGAGGIRGLTGAGVRAGAGATSGMIGGLAAEGTPAGAAGGALVGGLTPGIAAVGKSIALGAWDSTLGRVMRPTQTSEQALLNALGGTPEAGREAIAGISRGEATAATPGLRRNLVELLEAGGVRPTTDLAALASRLENAGGQTADNVLKFQQEQVGALRQQLLQINDQLRVPMLTPGRMSELQTVRDNILTQIDAEEAILNAAARSATEGAAGVQGAGQTIAQRAAELSEGLRNTLVRPAYRKAIDSAQGVTTDIGGLIADAERVLGRPLSEFSPETAPAVVRAIADMAPQARPVPPPPPGGESISARLARRMSGQQEAGPATATLQQLDDLRKAINSDIAAARRGTGNLSNVTVANLQSLHSSVDRMVRQSTTFSDDTKQLYDTALANYRNVYAPRFREGETARILKPGMFGEMRIEPSQVVGSFLKDADAADQFVRTFAGDTAAFNALRDGIVEQMRKSALDGFTVSPKKLESFLATNAPVLQRYEQAGMNLRGAIHRMEQEAAASKAAFDNLQTFRGPFQNKTPDQILSYITADPARMNLALQRSDAAGQDAIRRVVAEQLNTQLESNPAAVLKELTTESSRNAYRLAISPNLVNEFTERARLGIAAQQALKDPALKLPGVAEKVVGGANLSLPQLQSLLQVAQDDIARMARIDAIAQRGGATPRVGALTREVAEEGATAAVMPNSSMSAAMNAIVRTFSNIEQKVNRKVNAELARVIYENPQAGIQAIQNAIARAEKRARPAGMVRRAAPAAGGALGGMIGEQVRQQYQPEPQQ